jgi:uncharacterized cupin superfamily protein
VLSVHESSTEVEYMEVGERTKSDKVEYTCADLKTALDTYVGWIFSHKDGSPH